MSATNAYDAASQGRRLQVWRPTAGGPNASMMGAGAIVRRARDLYRNNGWAAASSERSVSNAIGTGIQCKPQWGSPEFRVADVRLWSRWIKAGVIDADGILGIEGLQALAWREVFEAGEVFVRLRNRRASDGLPVPLQVQLIESEQCPHDYYATAQGGNQIKAGVEFDKIGRRVAYWMYGAHPGEYTTGEIDTGTLKRIPAEQIRHIYRPHRAGAHRGLPRMTPVMVRLWNMGNLEDAVLERHKIGNLFALWYVREAGTPDDDDGSVQEEMQTDTAADDTPLAGLEPGTAQELPAGVKPEFSSPPDPGATFAETMRGHLLAFSAAQGVPHEVLTGDLRNVSDRALRLILNEFRRLIESDLWNYFIPLFCQAIREAYFDAAVLAGALEIPGYADIREEVVKTLWVPQGWPYSHPVQDVTADIKAIRGGLQSRTATILSNGDDPEQVDAEIANDNERADAMGLSFDTDGRRPASGPATGADSAPSNNNEDA